VCVLQIAAVFGRPSWSTTNAAGVHCRLSRGLLPNVLPAFYLFPFSVCVALRLNISVHPSTVAFGLLVGTQTLGVASADTLDVRYYCRRHFIVLLSMH